MYKEKAVVGALWSLVIALCVQGGGHPLDHELIARTTSHYQGKTPRERTLSGNVVRTHRILLQLGIDISTDLCYDT